MASTVIDCLDPRSQDLVMPHLSGKNWTYEVAKTAIGTEFSSAEAKASNKNDFFNITISPE